jgi:hypothetical protein
MPRLQDRARERNARNASMGWRAGVLVVFQRFDTGSAFLD